MSAYPEYIDTVIYDIFRCKTEKERQDLNITNEIRQFMLDRLQSVDSSFAPYIAQHYEQNKPISVFAKENDIPLPQAKQIHIKLIRQLRTAGETYSAQYKRQQEEYNQLPIKYAFGNKQFDEMMSEWNLDPKHDLKAICRIEGIACAFARKVDLPKIHEVVGRTHLETEFAKQDDTFLQQMFRQELDNHEFPYTRDMSDAIYACGYTNRDFAENTRLTRILKKACAQSIKAYNNA